MSVDPSGLPSYILLLCVSIGGAMALQKGMLASGYVIFGNTIRTMNVFGVIGAFALLIMVIAYGRWL